MYQEILDIASELSGTTITDHREAIVFLLKMSRDAESIRQKFNLSDGQSLLDYVVSLKKKNEELLAEKKKLNPNR